MIRILLHPVWCMERNQYASHLLQYFAYQSAVLHGDEVLVYDVHIMCNSC